MIAKILNIKIIGAAINFIILFCSIKITLKYIICFLVIGLTGFFNILQFSNPVTEKATVKMIVIYSLSLKKNSVKKS